MSRSIFPVCFFNPTYTVVTTIFPFVAVDFHLLDAAQFTHPDCKRKENNTTKIRRDV